MAHDGHNGPVHVVKGYESILVSGGLDGMIYGWN